MSRAFRFLDFLRFFFRIFFKPSAVASMTKSSVYFRVGLWLCGFSLAAICLVIVVLLVFVCKPQKTRKNGRKLMAENQKAA